MSSPNPTVTTDQVRRQLERLHQGKAAVPDCVGSRIQPEPELGENPGYLEDVLVTVPKKTTPSRLNDYRPVAPTSNLMKVLGPSDRMVLAHRGLQEKLSLDQYLPI